MKDGDESFAELHKPLIQLCVAGYHVDTTGFFEDGTIGGSLRPMVHIERLDMKYGTGLLR